MKTRTKIQNTGSITHSHMDKGCGTKLKVISIRRQKRFFPAARRIEVLDHDWTEERTKQKNSFFLIKTHEILKGAFVCFYIILY